MTHTNLVANELAQSGFKVQKFNDIVIVSLSNRKVSMIEVKAVLVQEFDDHQFDLVSTTNEVLVSW